MAYKHGVYTYEVPTRLVAPVNGTAGLQVIFGTAPVNMASNPYDCTNKPMICYDYAECVKNIGFSYDWKNYTLCQSVYACFKVKNIAPIILVNVLDPKKHIKDMEANELAVIDSQAIIEQEGVLLDKLVLKDGENVLTADVDYTLEFTTEGYVLITVLTSAVTIKATGKVLAPEMVTPMDIVGGYDVAKGIETGMETIRQIYPLFGITPGLLLAPGWSHNAVVATTLQAKCEGINDLFTCECICDVDSTSIGATKYTDVKKAKEDGGLNSIHCLPIWPKAKVGDLEFWGSAIAGALTAYTDAQNDDVPNLSPSNKAAGITATCIDGGEEIILDQSRANLLNSQGITTFINKGGYNLWGGRTAAYPNNTDPKDMWFNCRRFFSWRRNSFILTFSQMVDRNADPRLIQTICDTENIIGNGYVARGYCAGDRIEFDMNENSATDILNGTIRFHEYLAPYTPAHEISNTFEFDVDTLMSNLAGGE